MTALGWFLIVLSFVLGSIPFGVIVARLFKVRDLQSRGSGNIGATNVSRVLGFWPAGFIVFLLDSMKGVVGAGLITSLWENILEGALGALRELGGNWDFTSLPPAFSWWLGAAAVVGHCFTPWLRFRGGKGVATGFGALLVLSPMAALVGILAFGLAFVITRTGSLGSLAGILVATWLHLTLHPPGPELLPGALIVGIILIRHEQNIVAFLEARENRF